MAKKKKRSSGRAGRISIIIVILVLLGSLGVESMKLQKENEKYKKEEAALKEDINKETIRQKEIEELSKRVQTKQFAEEMAKEKLGLIYPGEIVFQEKDE